jgi:hypothetical protein
MPVVPYQVPVDIDDQVIEWRDQLRARTGNEKVSKVAALRDILAHATAAQQLNVKPAAAAQPDRVSA